MSNYTAVPRSTPPSIPFRPWYRRLPWWAIAVSVLVFATVPAAVDPIRDASTLADLSEAHLALPPTYLAITPVSNVLDALTLLSVPQHIVVVLSVIVLFIGYRSQRRRLPGSEGRRASLVREAAAALLLIVGIVVVYAVAALVPRPMAQLEITDPSVLAIDFHSHTMYSHDGRRGWTEEDVRGWHRGAGYDVAYITDHATFEGGERGIAGNPRLAGEGTMVLQGIEVVYRGEHVNVLSAGRRYRGLTTPNLQDLDEQALGLSSLIPATLPVIIETIPGNLDRVPASPSPLGPGARAIEIVDGSPRGLLQGRRDRARIVHLADSLNLALVTGSDNHGWGRVAPGWTLMRIPGWRGMMTDSLSHRIEEILRSSRREATRPVERRVAATISAPALVFAVPLITLRMLTTLSADERVMWLVWAWGIVLIGVAVRRYSAAAKASSTPA